MKNFRNTCGKFATGVTLITTSQVGNTAGITVNAFMSISLEPHLVAISINRGKKIREALIHNGKFAISVLARDQEKWSRHFGGTPQDGFTPAFTDFHGAQVVPGALAYFEASIVSQHEEGDHTLFIGQVNHHSCSSGEPLLFFEGAYTQRAVL